MSNDRNRRGLEDLVKLFDRLFFCRSFHSKLFPVGGLREGRTAGLHPSSYPKPDPRGRSLRTCRARRHLEACPPRALRPWAVEVRTKPASQPRTGRDVEHKIRSSPVYAGHAIKPLKTRSSRGRLQSWTGSRHFSMLKAPALIPLKATGLLPFEHPCGHAERNDLLSSQVFGMRARTRQQRGQHARRPLCSGSGPSCQEQNSDQFRPDLHGRIRPLKTRRSYLLLTS